VPYLVPPVSLDIDVQTGIYHRSVGTFVKITVVLLVIVAVTTILLTPTAKDDVVGVLHKGQVYSLHLSNITLPFLVTLPAHVAPEVEPSPLPDSTALLDLVCVRLC
jgi:hypothetical protein